MQAAQTAIARAQALLDPTGQGLFTSERLMPYLNIAYSSLRDEGVTAQGVTAMETVVVLPSVPAYTRDLSAYVAPGGMLENLAGPIDIREKPAGTGDENYLEVTRVDELPSRRPDDFHGVYEWRGGNIFFVGAAQNLDLQIRYEQIWPAIKDPTAPLGAVGIATILGYWTAGLMAAAMREQATSAAFIAEARHLLFRWIQRQIMDAQNVTRRPRPYNGGGFGMGIGLGL